MHWRQSWWPGVARAGRQLGPMAGRSAPLLWTAITLLGEEEKLHCVLCIIYILYLDWGLKLWFGVLTIPIVDIRPCFIQGLNFRTLRHRFDAWHDTTLATHLLYVCYVLWMSVAQLCFPFMQSFPYFIVQSQNLARKYYFKNSRERIFVLTYHRTFR